VSLYRKELCVIYFNTRKRPAPLGVRGSEVCIPNPRYTGAGATGAGAAGAGVAADASADAKSSSGGGGGGGRTLYNISHAFEKIRKENKQNELYSRKCFILHERTSKYDPLSSCLVDFKGRANIASIKNFQLVESVPLVEGQTQSEANDKEFLLQLGKVRYEYCGGSLIKRY
jgi:hypothetical protein